MPLGRRFVLEPEAQIIFQQVAFTQANDGLSPVEGTTSGETGRVGLRAMWTVDGYNGQVWLLASAGQSLVRLGAEATDDVWHRPGAVDRGGDGGWSLPWGR